MDLPFRGSQLESGSEIDTRLANNLRTFYFGENGTVDNEKLNEFIEMLSDMWKVVDMIDRPNLLAANSDSETFYYRLSVNLKLNQQKVSFNISLPGSSRADELCYLFRCKINPKLYDDVNEGLEGIPGLETCDKIMEQFC